MTERTENFGHLRVTARSGHHFHTPCQKYARLDPARGCVLHGPSTISDGNSRFCPIIYNRFALPNRSYSFYSFCSSNQLSRAVTITLSWTVRLQSTDNCPQARNKDKIYTLDKPTKNINTHTHTTKERKKHKTHTHKVVKYKYCSRKIAQGGYGTSHCRNCDK